MSSSLSVGNEQPTPESISKKIKYLGGLVIRLEALGVADPVNYKAVMVSGLKGIYADFHKDFDAGNKIFTPTLMNKLKRTTETIEGFIQDSSLGNFAITLDGVLSGRSKPKILVPKGAKSKFENQITRGMLQGKLYRILPKNGAVFTSLESDVATKVEQIIDQFFVDN